MATDLILEKNLQKISTRKKRIVKHMAEVTMMTIGI